MCSVAPESANQGRSPEADVTEFAEADITHSDVVTQKASLEYDDEESRALDVESRSLMLLEVILAWLFFFRL